MGDPGFSFSWGGGRGSQIIDRATLGWLGYHRNEPKWEVPIELRRNFPKLPIICDASHIAGKASLVAEISQIAMDLDMNGLMIETHHNPSIALSDSKQQINPNNLIKILNNLVLRKKKFKNDGLNNELLQFQGSLYNGSSRFILRRLWRLSLVQSRLRRGWNALKSYSRGRGPRS